MNFNKKKGISTVAVLLILAVFNTAAFLLPLKRTVTFWIGYSFEMIAAVILLACLLFLFDSGSKERTFLRLPTLKIGWAYFVIQTALCSWEITGAATTYLSAIIINSCLMGVYIVSILASSAAGENIEKQEEHVAGKVFFIKNMESIVSQIKAPDKETADRLKKLQDDIRFSDPMSHSMLEELENRIEAEVVTLKSEIGDRDRAMESMERISDLLKERNQKCRLYKNVKENKNGNDNTGVKYVSVTIGVLGAIAAVTAVICCVVIPNNIYKTGVSLYESEKYEDAAEIFESLNGFSDSEKMIAACSEGIKSVKYTDAQELFKDKEYDKAIAEFEELDGYKDSKEMIESVKQKKVEDKYALAESKFNSQNYAEALKLYGELGDYRDSMEKREKIKNRLAEDDVLYYGTYNGSPIAWQVIKNENNRMLLIAKNAVCELPYNDEIKDVDMSDSSLFKWLNGEFMKSFSENQQADIIPQKVDGAECKVFLLEKSDVKKIENRNILVSDCDWWLLSKSDDQASAMYVSKNGVLNENGEKVVRAKGVRPCIWIEL